MAKLDCLSYKQTPMSHDPGAEYKEKQSSTQVKAFPLLVTFASSYIHSLLRHVKTTLRIYSKNIFFKSLAFHILCVINSDYIYLEKQYTK